MWARSSLSVSFNDNGSQNSVEIHSAVSDRIYLTDNMFITIRLMTSLLILNLVPSSRIVHTLSEQLR